MSSIDKQATSRSKVKVYRNEQYMNISPTEDSASIQYIYTVQQRQSHDEGFLNCEIIQ